MERALRSMLVIAAVNFIAFFQNIASVFNTVRTDFAGAQIAFCVVTEIDNSTLGFNGLKPLPVTTEPLFVCGAEVVERVTAHLLNTEGDTFTFDVDRENNCFEFFALLVLANSFFTGFCPRTGRRGERDRRYRLQDRWKHRSR